MLWPKFVLLLMIYEDCASFQAGLVENRLRKRSKQQSASLKTRNPLSSSALLDGSQEFSGDPNPQYFLKSSGTEKAHELFQR